MSLGTGERLGGTWYLSLDGEASTQIDAAAPAEEVSRAIANLTAAGNISVTDSAGGEGYNGEREWAITFHDWNDPNRTVSPPVIVIGDESLTGTRAAAHLEAAGVSFIASEGELDLSHVCVKAVVQISSLISSGVIDECAIVASWDGGATYTVPAFSVDANASSVQDAFSAVDSTALGEVWVSRDGVSSAGGGVWNVTFVGNVEDRLPELDCGSDAAVSRVANATCDAIGGTFVLSFDGNATEEIAYNASALEVRNGTFTCYVSCLVLLPPTVLVDPFLLIWQSCDTTFDPQYKLRLVQCTNCASGKNGVVTSPFFLLDYCGQLGYHVIPSNTRKVLTTR